MALRADRAGATAVVVAATLSWLSCGPGDAKGSAPATPEAVAAQRRLRDQALAQARVWQPPAIPVGAADLRNDPPGPLQALDEIECRYQFKLTGGLTPKFHCALPSGRVVKVKYGKANAEPRAEVAATRLLSALGFGADRMYVVKRIRCDGCPVYPHPRWGLLNRLFARDGGHADFEDVTIEDPLPGRSIDAGKTQGWAWHEMDAIDPARGASRTERDALRLISVFLADWDNKANNQRLVCLPGGDLPDGGCSAPFAYLQDVGATFGPWGLDLEAWRKVPIWADAATCRVSMTALPYGGATFRDTAVSEAGRRLLADELKQLRPEQLRDLFTASGFTEFLKSSEAGRNVDNWVSAFEDKVRQIADRPPCPQP